jgi:magnesium/cobalt transport protein CorA
MATTARATRSAGAVKLVPKSPAGPKRRSKPASPTAAAAKPRSGTAKTPGSPTARLFDASGKDRDVTLTAALVRDVDKDQMLWVDVEAVDDDRLERVAELFELRPESLRALREPGGPPRVKTYGSYLHLYVNAIASSDGTESVAPLALVAGPNFVLTVHDRPVTCLDAFKEHLGGETSIGQVDGPAFLAALLDWHLTAYFQAVDRLEQEADRLDHRALDPRSEKDLLTDLVQLRRRISNLRRALAPHREPFAALTRPELTGLGDPDDHVLFRALADRLERAIDSVEMARELVLGSFDVHMTRTAQRTNDVMKLLTLATVILLPGSVIAGIMGMNFKIGLFDDPAFFWIVIVVMLAIAVATIAVARFKRWI